MSFNSNEIIEKLNSFENKSTECIIDSIRQHELTSMFNDAAFNGNLKVLKRIRDIVKSDQIKKNKSDISDISDVLEEDVGCIRKQDHNGSYRGIDEVDQIDNLEKLLLFPCFVEDVNGDPNYGSPLTQAINSRSKECTEIIVKMIEDNPSIKPVMLKYGINGWLEQELEGNDCNNQTFMNKNGVVISIDDNYNFTLNNKVISHDSYDDALKTIKQEVFPHP